MENGKLQCAGLTGILVCVSRAKDFSLLLHVNIHDLRDKKSGRKRGGMAE